MFSNSEPSSTLRFSKDAPGNTRTYSDLHFTSDGQAMLKLELPQEIEDRLDLLTLKTGFSRQYYVLEAVLEHLDEMEAEQFERERREGLCVSEKEIGRDGVN